MRRVSHAWYRRQLLRLERPAGSKCLQSRRQTSVRACSRGLSNEPISTCGLIGFMAADDAARGSAEDAMMTGKVPRSAAHQRAFDAAFGIGRRRYGDKCNRNRGASKSLVHLFAPGKPIEETDRGGH